MTLGVSKTVIITRSLMALGLDLDVMDFFEKFPYFLEICVINEKYGHRQILEVYIECNPDITLIDVTATQIDGVEIITKIKHLKQDAIIICISSDQSLEFKEKLYALGITKILHKPYDIEELVKVIEPETTDHVKFAYS